VRQQKHSQNQSQNTNVSLAQRMSVMATIQYPSAH